MAKKTKKKFVQTSDERAELISYLPPKVGPNGTKMPHLPYLVSFNHEGRELSGAWHRYTACSDKKWTAPGKALVTA